VILHEVVQFVDNSLSEVDVRIYDNVVLRSGQALAHDKIMTAAETDISFRVKVGMPLAGNYGAQFFGSGVVDHRNPNRLRTPGKRIKEFLELLLVGIECHHRRCHREGIRATSNLRIKTTPGEHYCLPRLPSV
jgi:hypothetical protein